MKALVGGLNRYSAAIGGVHLKKWHAVTVNLSELRIALGEHGVRGDSYDLDLEGFTLPNDRYCIRKEGAYRWMTYYSERGQRWGERTWISESEACDHLFQVLVRDGTTGIEP